MEPLEEEVAFVPKKGMKRFTSFVFSRKGFNEQSFHGLTMGAVVGLTMNEVAVYLMLRMSAELAEIPSFVTDALIVLISALEAVLGPFFGWLGQERRPRTMAVWLMLAALSTLPMFFVGFAHIDWTDMDLCNAAAVPQSSGSVVITRLVSMAALGLVSALARSAALAHGVAALDDFNPKNTLKNLGIIIGVRVVVLTIGLHGIETLVRSSLWLQALLLALPLLVKCLLLQYCPLKLPLGDEALEHKKAGGTGFLKTLFRVLYNGSAMSHAVSAGMLSAGAWGFAFHNEAFVQAKYLLVFASSQAANQATAIRMLAIVIMVVLVGYQLAAPTAREFDKPAAVKKTLWMALISLAALVVMVLLRCHSARLEGMAPGELVYQQPSFSLGCGCSKGYNTMFPVCALAEKVTYFSPCHAGCERRVDFQGTNILSACRGSQGAGEAFEGVCNGASCFGVYSLHEVLLVVFLTTVVVSLMLHCVLVLRAVDVRDKSTALGVTSSTVALLAFVCGHLLYMGISSWNCAFVDRGECRLHNWRFQYALGGATVTWTLVSAAINISSLRRLRNEN